MSSKPQKFVGATLDFSQISGIFKSKVLILLCLEELTLGEKKESSERFKIFKMC